MKYAILAAGEGSRMSHEGIGVPKPLVRINGETMLGRLVRIFMKNGAEHISVITNDLSPLTEEYVQMLIDKGLPLSLKVRNTQSSMHSFHEMMEMIGEGKFCLTTVDTVFPELEFRRYIKEFDRHDYDGLMAVTSYIDDEKPLYVSVNKMQEITGFHDEPCKSGCISAGIYCLTDRCFDVLGRCVAEGQSRMRNFQRALVAEGFNLKAYPFSKVIDVDHKSDIAKAEHLLRMRL